MELKREDIFFLLILYGAPEALEIGGLGGEVDGGGLAEPQGHRRGFKGGGFDLNGLPLKFGLGVDEGAVVREPHAGISGEPGVAEGEAGGSAEEVEESGADVADAEGEFRAAGGWIKGAGELNAAEGFAGGVVGGEPGVPQGVGGGVNLKAKGGQVGDFRENPVGLGDVDFQFQQGVFGEEVRTQR